MYDFKVYVATDRSMSYFKRMFKDVSVLPDKLPVECDLLIFPGGADVNPAKYGQPTFKFTSVNQEQDDIEFNAFSMYRRGHIKAKKALGICRGMQLINVALGGDLIQDLPSKNKEHKGIHKVEWKRSIIGPMNELDFVNSYHHQGINYMADSMRYKILAVEPETNILEAVLWGDSILGVQFHPEFMQEHFSRKFFDSIELWIKGEALAERPLPRKKTTFTESTTNNLNYQEAGTARAVIGED